MYNNFDFFIDNVKILNFPPETHVYGKSREHDWADNLDSFWVPIQKLNGKSSIPKKIVHMFYSVG